MNAAMTRTNTPQAVGVPTIRKFRIVQSEGALRVERLVDHYRFEQRRRTAAELEAENDAVKQLTETAKKLPADKKKGGKA